MIGIVTFLLLACMQIVDLTSASSDGWSVEDSGWGTFDAHGDGSGDISGPSKQEVRQKRLEERRLKQQAAREKRAAGSGLKPGGLGAVKRD